MTDRVTATDTSTKQEIPRDRWGRPCIYAPEVVPLLPRLAQLEARVELDDDFTEEEANEWSELRRMCKPLAYTRMSTLAKVLDDPTNLTKWKQRQTAIGLLKRPALMTRLSGIVANGDLDGYEAKKNLNRLCEDAIEASGGSDRASAGTGLHALTEALDAGKPLEFVAPADLARVHEYRAATEGYTPLKAEGFVVVDEIQAAGSYDRLWRCPDGAVRLGDLKTGAWDKRYPMGVTAQLSGYAHGSHYDLETGEREPIHPDLDLSVGLLISMPPSGGCEVVGLNLEVGWRVLLASIEAHRLRKLKAKDFFSDLG
jgi:hypothetical protein